MVKIQCNDDCRYLEGASFQKKRSEAKEFSELMARVGQGQYDDIFQRPDVAMMAFEIESLIRNLHMGGDMQMTDTTVYEAYKSLYKIVFQGKVEMTPQEVEPLAALLEQYEERHRAWQDVLDETTMGQVYLRLMISVRSMSGGRFGEYGYLNYLKNNLGGQLLGDECIIEDKFGNKMRHKL
jgi:hypothetical protein